MCLSSAASCAGGQAAGHGSPAAALRAASGPAGGAGRPSADPGALHGWEDSAGAEPLGEPGEPRAAAGDQAGPQSDPGAAPATAIAAAAVRGGSLMFVCLSVCLFHSLTQLTVIVVNYIIIS